MKVKFFILLYFCVLQSYENSLNLSNFANIKPKNMLSIITAIYNQLDMNKLYYQYLKKYTDNKFELIIIDNNSDDGSREYFKSLGDDVKVIENKENYSYPHCQNQGIEVAQYDYLIFLNNDLLVSPHWDSRMLEVLGKDDYHVVSFGSNDRLFDNKTSKKITFRWKIVKYPLITLFKQNILSLKLMRLFTYGNWENYTEKIYKRYGLTMSIGFSGSAIAMTRMAIDKIGMWDKSQQSADFDTFFRTCKRAETVGDIKVLSVINGVFVHHYRRLTFYTKYPPFSDRENLSTLSIKWDKNDLDRWLKLIN